MCCRKAYVEIICAWRVNNNIRVISLTDLAYNIILVSVSLWLVESPSRSIVTLFDWRDLQDLSNATMIFRSPIKK